MPQGKNDPAKDKNAGENIVIDVPNSNTAQAFADAKGFLQEKALQRVMELVDETCGRIDGYKKLLIDTCYKGNVNQYKRFHDTIFIDGDRGTGKTSFILTALEKICCNNAICRSICSLGIIDPTLVTTKNNIFILVISRIKESVESVRDKRCPVCDPDLEYQEWNESLKKLASGLSMLDQVGTKPLEKDEWADAQYVLQKGIADAAGGLELESSFNRFVFNSLKFIQKDAFVLGFDDIDTDFSKGNEIMEVLRKYITTPQIIVLMTANYSLLYDMTLQRFWDFFHNKYFTASKGVTALRREVEDIVSQYLKKICIPERRVALQNPHEIKNSLYIKNEKYGDTPLIGIFQALVAIWFRLPDGICRYIGDFFFKLPVRSMIMLVSALQKKEKVFAVMVQLAKKFDEQKENRDAWLLEQNKIDIELFTDNNFFDVYSQILYVYLEELMSMGYSVDDLRDMFNNFKMYKVGKQLFEKELLGTCSSIMPKDVLRVSDNDIFLLYQMVYGGFVADIKNIFEYFIRVLMLRDIVNIIGYKSEIAKNIINKYYKEQSSPFELCDSFVKVFLLNDDKKENLFLEVKKPDSKGILTNIYNFICFKFSSSATEKNYFSIYHYFAFLLFCCETPGDLEYALEQYTSLRTFSKHEGKGDNNISEVLIKNMYMSQYSGQENAAAGRGFSDLSEFVGSYLDPDKGVPCRWAISCPPYVLFNAYSKFLNSVRARYYELSNIKFEEVFAVISDIFISCIECEEEHYRKYLPQLWKEGTANGTGKKYKRLYNFLNKLSCMTHKILKGNSKKCEEKCNYSAIDGCTQPDE